MARSFAAALAPSHHAGHSHVVGWYERDMQDGLRHVMTMPMSREASGPSDSDESRVGRGEKQKATWKLGKGGVRRYRFAGLHAKGEKEDE